jgi:hypothetical protein
MLTGGIEDLIRRAKASISPGALAECDAQQNRDMRREMRFIGYGRGAKLDLYERARRHLKYAADRFRDAGPQFQELAALLDQLFESIPGFPKR